MLSYVPYVVQKKQSLICFIWFPFYTITANKYSTFEPNLNRRIMDEQHRVNIKPGIEVGVVK